MTKLENFTLDVDASSETSAIFISNLNQQISQIESLGNVTTFSLNFRNEALILSNIVPPYGDKMKNLKTLSLNVIGRYFKIGTFTEALKDLVDLEIFNFEYFEYTRTYAKRESFDCSFSFEKLQNLKSVCLNCYLPLSKKSRKELVNGISRLENLESLEIFEETLNGMDKKEASEFIEDLCLKKTLKFTSFGWKGPKSSHWIEVNIEEVNGEMVVPSGLKQIRDLVA